MTARQFARTNLDAAGLAGAQTRYHLLPAQPDNEVMARAAARRAEVTPGSKDTVTRRPASMRQPGPSNVPPKFNSLFTSQGPQVASLGPPVPGPGGAARPPTAGNGDS
jgi:hypothetical protein